MSMHRYLRLCQSLLLPVSMLAPSACGSDGVQLPGPGSIHVIATTTGTDLDLDGYLAQVDGEEVPHLLLPNVALILNNMDEEMYMVTLRQLSANCTADVTQQLIPVSAGEVSEALFNVSCAELPAATVDVTGTWDGTYEGYGSDPEDNPPGSGTIHFELVQSGDEVTGTVSTDGRLEYPVTGRVSGNSLELFHVGWYEPLMQWYVRITTRGQVSDSVMNGTHSEMRDAWTGTWTATRQ